MVGVGCSSNIEGGFSGFVTHLAMLDGWTDIFL